MSKKQFWSRLVLYFLFGAIIPVAFLIWRFQLFRTTEGIAVGGWGLVAIVFIAIFFMKTIKNIERGLEFSIATQCLVGVRTIILPLVIATFCIYYMRDFMEQIYQFLFVVICTQIVAIPINPFPQWNHEHGIEMEENRIKAFLQTVGVIKKDLEDKP